MLGVPYQVSLGQVEALRFALAGFDQRSDRGVDVVVGVLGPSRHVLRLLPSCALSIARAKSAQSNGVSGFTRARLGQRRRIPSADDSAGSTRIAKAAYQRGCRSCEGGTKIAARSTASGLYVSRARRWWRSCRVKAAAPMTAPRATGIATECMRAASSTNPAHAPITTLLITATIPAAVSVSCHAPGDGAFAGHGPVRTTRYGSSSGGGSREKLGKGAILLAKARP